MNAPLFDTHQMVKRLIAAGFSDSQAETVTDVVREARQVDLDNLATKSDLRDLRAEFKTDLAGLKTELKTDIADVRTELGQLRADLEIRTSKLFAAIADSRTETLRWIVGLALTQTGLIVAVLKMLQTP